MLVVGYDGDSSTDEV